MNAGAVTIPAQRPAPSASSEARFRVYCLSAGRPERVGAIMDVFGWDTVFVTPPEQTGAYLGAGAYRVLGAPDTSTYPLAAARNYAMDDAFTTGCVCVQTDDDLDGLYAVPEGRRKPTPATFADYTAAWRHAHEATGAFLVGCMPAGSKSGRHEVESAYIPSRLFAMWPNTAGWAGRGLRFDESLPLYEDWDLTAAHISRRGRVARCGWLMPRYVAGPHPGGRQDRFRGATLERETRDKLIRRWPDHLSTAAGGDGLKLIAPPPAPTSKDTVP